MYSDTDSYAHYQKVMGNVCNVLQNVFTFSSRSPSKVIFLGLDGAGKTSILYRLKCDDSFEITPTIGFNVEMIQLPARGTSFTVWDVRGDSKISPLWKLYFPDCKGVVFVVDASDTSRFEEAKEELDWVLKSDEIAGIPFVLLVNKQDLPQAARPSDVAQKLGLSDNKINERKILVKGTSARTGEGLVEAMQELSKMISDIS